MKRIDSSSDSKLMRYYWHVASVVLTFLAVVIFAYFIYEAGIQEIYDGIGRLGFGFLLLIVLYGLKISARAAAWKLSLERPTRLGFLNALRAVTMGEALTNIIPLGILTSGTTKAVAVRNQLPLIEGLSSVAIENLFYSLATAILFLGGGATFLGLFEPTGNIAAASYALIFIVSAAIVGGFLLVINQWHFASALANWLYERNVGTRFLELGRAEVQRFEDLIYGFYHRQPRRFLPIMTLEMAFHALGVLEVWIILTAISDVPIHLSAALLLESVNHIILFVFKLIPFALGVDEAGARYITDALSIGAGVGVTMAIIRKGRALFWTFFGMMLIVQSGLSWGEIDPAANPLKRGKEDLV